MPSGPSDERRHAILRAVTVRGCELAAVTYKLGELRPNGSRRSKATPLLIEKQQGVERRGKATCTREEDGLLGDDGQLAPQLVDADVTDRLGLNQPTAAVRTKPKRFVVGRRWCSRRDWKESGIAAWSCATPRFHATMKSDAAHATLLGRG